MTKKKLSVIDKMRARLETTVNGGDFATASDCLRDLLRARMEREAKLSALRQAVSDGFDSGPSKVDWAQLLQAMRNQAERPHALGWDRLGC